MGFQGLKSSRGRAGNSGSMPLHLFRMCLPVQQHGLLMSGLGGGIVITGGRRLQIVMPITVLAPHESCRQPDAPGVAEMGSSLLPLSPAPGDEPPAPARPA